MFDDLPGGLTRSAYIRTHRWDSSHHSVKEYRANPAKGKGTWREGQRKPGASFQITLPMESHKSNTF